MKWLAGTDIVKGPSRTSSSRKATEGYKRRNIEVIRGMILSSTACPFKLAGVQLAGGPTQAPGVSDWHRHPTRRHKMHAVSPALYFLFRVLGILRNKSYSNGTAL